MRTPLLRRCAAGCGLLLTIIAAAVLAHPAEATPAREPQLAPPVPPATLCGSWSQRALYPGAYGTVGTAMVAQGGVLYRFSETSSSYKYDPATDVWTAISSPSIETGASAVGDGTYIYLLNGNISATTFSRYDPATDHYTTLAVPPHNSTRQSEVYLNGYIYRIGGAGPTVDRYSISTGAWAPPGTVADYPLLLSVYPLWGLKAIAANGYLYAAGGTTNNDTVIKTYRYDPGTNTWDDAAITDLPEGRAYAMGDILDGRWLITGGLSVNHQFAFDTIALDLSTPNGAWSSLPW
ncbi:MAG TPA: kelch repeat-containing protein, partial [Chloroflexia bacterium]|nr:kelch repeat-containing protein [Chloroflexia bacterium]